MKKFTLLFFLSAVPIFSQMMDSTKYVALYLQDKLSLFVSVNVSNSLVVSHSDSSITYRTEPSLGLGIEWYLMKNEEGSNAGLGAEYQFKLPVGQ